MKIGLLLLVASCALCLGCDERYNVNIVIVNLSQSQIGKVVVACPREDPITFGTIGAAGQASFYGPVRYAVDEPLRVEWTREDGIEHVVQLIPGCRFPRFGSKRVVFIIGEDDSVVISDKSLGHTE